MSNSRVRYLKDTYPEIAQQWHPTLNSGSVEDIRVSSTQLVWWLGDCGHAWESTPRYRVSGSGCQYCSGRKILSGFNDLQTLFPDLAAQWHPTLNKDLTPLMVGKGSTKNYWWQCEHGHSWEASINSRRSYGTGCPYCSGKRVLAGLNDLATTHPDIAAEWHPTKNNELLATQYTRGSETKVWWLGQCGHEWESAIHIRAVKRAGCPVCLGRLIICGINDLATTHPTVADEWHPHKNVLTPHQVTYSANTQVWWQCSLGHGWKSYVFNRTKESGNTCPYCANKKALPGFNDLSTTHADIASEWHPTKNTKVGPTQITSGSETKVWWMCGSGHEWKTAVNNRTSHQTSCPVCFIKVSRIETQLANALGKQYQDLKQGYLLPVKWLAVNNRNYSANIDIFIPDLNVIIEYDGWYWHKDRLPQDIQKTTALLDAGYTVIRVRAHPLVPTGISHDAYAEVVHTDESPEDLADIVATVITRVH